MDGRTPGALSDKKMESTRCAGICYTRTEGFQLLNNGLSAAGVAGQQFLEGCIVKLGFTFYVKKKTSKVDRIISIIRTGRSGFTSTGIRG